MSAFADLVRFVPTLGGTTDWTYASAVGGCQSPALANVQNGASYKVYAVSADLTQWEVSTGTYNSSSGVFARTTVLYNSSGTGTAAGQSGAGTKISFSTVPSVSIVALAEDLISVEVANSFTVAQRLQARTNISAVLKGQCFGLALSTAGASSTFGIAVGEAADSTGVDLMVLASAYTKTTSAWALGTASGALDTGTIAASTWYHAHLIKRPDTGVVDVLVSLSATAPTMPTNYTLFRRVGSMLTDGSSHWTKFVQVGDEFLFDVSPLNVNGFNGTTAIQTATLSTPPGVQTDAILTVFSVAGAVFDSRGWIFSPDTNSGAALSTTAATVNFGANLSASGLGMAAQMTVRTNASSQVKYAMFTTSGTVSISTAGWIDRRGRLF